MVIKLGGIIFCCLLSSIRKVEIIYEPIALKGRKDFQSTLKGIKTAGNKLPELEKTIN